MGLLLNWFGIESIDKNIEKEISLIDSLLEDVSDIDGVINNIGLRKKKLKQVLAPKGRLIRGGLALRQKVKQKLEPYLKGEKKTKDLVKILVLHKILTDLDEDILWKELLELWHEEYALLDEGNLDKARQNLIEQQHIAKILKKIVELEFNETHVHFGPSVDADLHWNCLKKLWKRSLAEINRKPELKAEISRIQRARSDEIDAGSYAPNIILMLEAYNRTYNRSFTTGKPYKRLYDDDKKALYKIMRNYLSGKWTETKAFVEFERLLIMPKEEHGTFRGFHRKAELLTIMQLAVSATDERREYFLQNLDNMVKHNLAHNITHIEIRYPLHQLEGIEFFYDITREVEKKYGGRVAIRYIQFKMKPEESKEFYARYAKLPANIKKYIVGIDFMEDLEKNPEALEIAEKSGLPLCVHAGELFKPNVDSVKSALHDVETALDHPTIHRIGHATILGIDLKEYLKKKASAVEIKRLEAKQEELIQRIKKQGVYIEANPSSNVKIAGIKHYGEHPILKFSEKDVKFAISTDDRVSFDTNLKKEFYRIARAMKWSVEQIEKASKMQKEAMLK